MTTLKELSIALGLLTSDPTPTAVADGWVDYVWRIRDVQRCLLETDFCSIIDDRWDWKRPQFYSAAFKTDIDSNTVTTRLTLRNEDPADDDQICIVVNYLDADGELVGIFFANWRSLSMRSYSREAPVTPSASVKNIAKVLIGSKQCEVRATEDSKNFSRIRQKLNQR